MNIYTIGFTKKTAEKFFSLLNENNVSTLLDIRLNNSSQLSGFAKGKDLEYFCKVHNIKYIYEPRFAPNQKILDNYKKNRISWDEYEVLYNELLVSRNTNKILEVEYGNKLDNFCLLCSEDIPTKCHRRLFAEYISSNIENTIIKHLV